MEVCDGSCREIISLQKRRIEELEAECEKLRKLLASFQPSGEILGSSEPQADPSIRQPNEDEVPMTSHQPIVHQNSSNEPSDLSSSPSPSSQNVSNTEVSELQGERNTDSTKCNDAKDEENEELMESEGEEEADDPQWTGNHVELKGQWAASGGGCMNFDSFSSNPQFFLSVRHTSEVTVTLTSNDLADVDGAAMGFYVFHGTPHNRVLSDVSNLLAKSSFIDTPSVCEALHLPPSPCDYVIIPSLFDPDPGIAIGFSLSLTSSADVTFTPTTRRRQWRKCVVKGEWGEGTAGGCRNHVTWVNNPQYGVVFQKRKGDPSSSNIPPDSHVIFHLSQPEEDFCEVGLYAFSSASASWPFPRADDAATVLGKSRFSSPLSASLSLTHPTASALICMPCTFDPDVRGAFTLELWSNHPLSLLPLSSLSASSALSVDGVWAAGVSSGGCLNHSTWRQNPQYLLYIHRTSTISLKLSQNLKKDHEIGSVGVYVLSPLHDTTASLRRLTVTPADVIAKSPFLARGSTLTDPFRVEKSEYPHLVIAAPFNPGYTASFSLQLDDVIDHHPDGLSLMPVREWESACVESEWGEGTSGGCLQNPTWRQNPALRLVCRAGGVCHVRMRRGRTKVGAVCVCVCVCM